MNLFERYLTVWVGLCIIVGVLLGQFLPGVFQAIASLEIAKVNIPVGVLVWVMIIPMLLKIDFGALHQVKAHWRGIGVTLFINWAVKPFSMALLGWLFIRHVFAPYLPAGPARQLYRRTDSAGGRALHRDGVRVEPPGERRSVFHAVAGGAQRRHHGLRLRAAGGVAARHVASIAVPWDTLFVSVVFYIVIPVIIAQLLRRRLLANGEGAFSRRWSASRRCRWARCC